MKNPWRTAICALLLCGAFALGCLPAQAAEAAPATGAAPATEAAPAMGAAPAPAEITWPAQYRITYEIQLEDGRVQQITQARDAQGSLYFCLDGEETLFVQEGAHYRMYRRGLDGALEQAPGLFSGAYVQERTAALTDCAQRAAPRLRERAQCVGEQEVAGRTGLVYTCARSFLGFTWTRAMIVDEQTGLCLAWRAQSAIGDYSLSDGAGDFLCTDFVTQDVALPLSLEGQAA